MLFESCVRFLSDLMKIVVICRPMITSYKTSSWSSLLYLRTFAFEMTSILLLTLPKVRCKVVLDAVIKPDRLSLSFSLLGVAVMVLGFPSYTVYS